MSGIESNRSTGETTDQSDVGLVKTAVIIPARNEERSIGLVLDDLPAVATVIVADNGSTDRTACIASTRGAVVVHEPVAGYGRACLAGLTKLAELSVSADGAEIDYVAFVDADYSDHPQELSDLLHALRCNEADFVLGTRMHDRDPGAMPIQAVLGNRLACWLMRRIWGADYTDLGPFRVIRYARLVDLEMQDQDFGWTIEMQIKAKLARLHTLEIPVSYRRRIGVSKISGTVSGTLRAGYKILYTIAKYALTTRGAGLKSGESTTTRVTVREPI